MEALAVADSKVMERFVADRPLCVMTRCVLGHLMTPDLDDVFSRCRERQYEGEIKFSALATSVADVALNFCDNFNQAYKAHQKGIAASVVAYYGKLNRVEPSISEGVVIFSRHKAGELLREIGAPPEKVLPGYRCSVLDGNHLQKTEKRIGELRSLWAAALPGTVVAKFNLEEQLFERAYLLEDAHAQESSVLDRVVADLQTDELLIADRHFCIVKFLLGVAKKLGCFVIRQHGRLKGELLGKRRQIGRVSTGMVFEQQMRIGDGDEQLVVRRITIELDVPTRDGDLQIHLLSNVPVKHAGARQLAELYHQRWEIENAFHVLTMTLTCEVKSIGHPRAALFLFCTAMLAYNCRQVLFGALKMVHDQSAVENMSHHSVALEIAKPMDGLITAIPESEWDQLVPCTASGRAKFLCCVARRVDVHYHKKTVRGPKKPQQPRKQCAMGTHVSTHRLLQQRKETR